MTDIAKIVQNCFTDDKTSFQIDNEHFVSHLYDHSKQNYSKRNDKEIMLWARNGNLSLGQFSFSDDTEAHTQQLVTERIEQCMNGYIHCSDCGKLTEKPSGYHHMYFAGAYCNECWEKKWKEIEANESYD